MRSKVKQLKAMEAELAAMQQALNTGKELAELSKQSPGKTALKLGKQLLANAKVRRGVEIAGGVLVVGYLSATASKYKFYQTVVSREVNKALKPVNEKLDRIERELKAIETGEQPEALPEPEKKRGRKRAK